MALFKFVVKKPAETEATPAAPKKKKTALKVIEGGKSSKKKKAVTKAKATTPAKTKGKRPTSVPSKHVVPSSPKLEKLISSVDAAYAGEEAQKEKINTALSTLYDFLENEGAGFSFKHPKKGLYSVMKRGKIFFWRPKPKGRG